MGVPYFRKPPHRSPERSSGIDLSKPVCVCVAKCVADPMPRVLINTYPRNPVPIFKALYSTSPKLPPKIHTLYSPAGVRDPEP